MEKKKTASGIMLSLLLISRCKLAFNILRRLNIEEREDI